MSKKTAFSEHINKYWSVTTNKKVTSYGETRHLGVVAMSALDVAEKVVSSFPDETIVSISHVGAVDLT